MDDEAQLPDDGLGRRAKADEIPTLNRYQAPLFDRPARGFFGTKKRYHQPSRRSMFAADEVEVAAFVTEVERMLALEARAPAVFRDGAGEVRGMATRFLKAVGPEGRHIFDYERDPGGYITGLRHRNVSQDEARAEALEGKATEKDALIQTRVGQVRFRAELLSRWNDACAITGCRTPELLRASHIVPWCSATDAERLDCDNGLPLIANLDALFDRGTIAFDERGFMAVKRLRFAELGSFLPSTTFVRLRNEPSAKQAGYLRRHWEAYGFNDQDVLLSGNAAA